jgi:hypothetical protein
MDPNRANIVVCVCNVYSLHSLFVWLVAGGWWLVLICAERKVLLPDCWWLVCSERKILLAGG